MLIDFEIESVLFHIEISIIRDKEKRSNFFGQILWQLHLYFSKNHTDPRTRKEGNKQPTASQKCFCEKNWSILQKACHDFSVILVHLVLRQLHHHHYHHTTTIKHYVNISRICMCAIIKVSVACVCVHDVMSPGLNGSHFNYSPNGSMWPIVNLNYYEKKKSVCIVAWALIFLVWNVMCGTCTCMNRTVTKICARIWLWVFVRVTNELIR